MPDETAFDRDIDGEKQFRGARRGPTASHSHDRWIAELAGTQHGVISRGQLLAAGWSSWLIDRRLGCGRLHVVHRGVYSVGHRILTRDGGWMAAVLAGGWAATLSFGSAGELWRLIPPSDRWPEVTLPRSRRGRSGIRWHSSELRPDEVTVIRGIRVTTVPRTLLDLAAVLKRRPLERAINEAEVQGHTDPLSLPALLDRYPRRRGTAAIRAVLAEGRIGAGVTKSELEERFLRFLADRGLPRPEPNVSIALRGGFVEVDCVWRSSRLIVELDGRAVHGTARAFERDRARDRALGAAGWRVIRITWRQLSEEASELAEDLGTMLGGQPAHPVDRRRQHM
jgi:hypothetical protein